MDLLPCSIRGKLGVRNGEGEERMHVFSLIKEQEWNSKVHVENILGMFEGGDVSVACWEPGQISPHHCHPDAIEIYFCFEGGGKMRTPDETVDVVPGAFVVHPLGELHEYINGPQRTLLFRVRYGTNVEPRIKEWPSNPDWKPNDLDRAYFGA